MPASPRIDDELIERARTDETVRARLASKGTLSGGYHPEMRTVHEANADWLTAELDTGFWPTAADTAPRAIAAFWTIVQHAISRPKLMRRVADLASAVGDPVTRFRRALLTDRIAVSEGRLQTFGTQVDWTPDGVLAPMPIGDASGVDARRADVGLMPLEPELVRMNGAAAAKGQKPPANFGAYIAERTLFAVEAGWRD